MTVATADVNYQNYRMLPETQTHSSGHFAVYYDKSYYYYFIFFVHPYRNCNIILVCVNNVRLRHQSKTKNMKKTARATLKNG